MSTSLSRCSLAGAMLVAFAQSGLVAQTTTPAQWSQWVPDVKIQHLRPRDERGINMFEPPKGDSVQGSGFAIQWGAAGTVAF